MSSEDALRGGLDEALKKLEPFLGRLPADVDAADWGHLYRLAVNTRLEGTGGPLGLGTAVLSD